MCLAVASLSAVVSTACGARYQPNVRQALLQGAVSGRGATGTGAGSALSGNGLSTGSGSSGSGTAAGSTLGGPATGGTSGGSTAAGGRATGQQAGGGRSNTSGGGAPAPAGGNGGATDVGVTANSITVGTVADLSGPQPGLFQGDVAAVQAYFSYVNSQGGIYGRQLKATVADSQTACQPTQNDYASLYPKVFAFVGGLSLYDQCGATVLKSHPQVPDLDFALTADLQNLPNNYNFQPRRPGVQLGFIRYFKHKYPNALRVGALYPKIASAESLWQQAEGGFKHEGYTVAYQEAYSPTQQDFTTEVLAMRRNNVNFVLLYGQMSGNATFINDAAQQGFHPSVIEDPGVDYDPQFAKIVGKNGNGVYVNLAIALWFNNSDRSIPGVSLYQTWMNRVAPSAPKNEFSAFGWANAALFVQALKQAGPKVTRAKLLSVLAKMHSFNAQGFVAPVDIGRKTPPTCYLIARYENGTWSRQDSPGFRCDAPYLYE